MCVGGSNGPSIFDKIKQAKQESGGKPVNPFDVLKGEKEKAQVAEQAALKQLAPDAAPVLGDRIEAPPIFSQLNKVLAINYVGQPTSTAVGQSRTVGAGRIGKSYGASDLRIG